MKSNRIVMLTGLAVVALCGCSAEHSTEEAAATSQPAAADVTGSASGAAAASGTPGTPASPAEAAANPASRAFIDPVTGEMRAPTAAELAASKTPASTEQAGKQQQRPQPAQTRLPDGTIMIDLRNQPQVEEKACVQADGSLGACPAR